MAHYVASKGGVIGLTKALALEFAPNGITVNTIPPGFIDTPMARRAEARGDLPSIDAVAARTPVRRAGTPDDIAAACVFLCSDDTRVSLADLIVLGGCAAVEHAAKEGGHKVTVPFTPGRTDASQEQTDAEWFAVLEPTADGFRNYLRAGEKLPGEVRLLDRANLLTLTAPELTVLVGGLRSLGANAGGAAHGILTDRPGTLSNDVFVNLLDDQTEWKVSASAEDVFEGRARGSEETSWTATAVDLVFGANSQLRAIAEVYASDDAEERFVLDFVRAWDKVMNLDRFDLA